MIRFSDSRHGGFTLLETLLTVAILVILLGVSAVGAARYRDPLKITELDNAARAIYMAAENRAVLLQNSGAAVSLLSSSAPDGGGPVLPDTSAPLDDGSSVSLRVLSDTADSAILNDLLPSGVIDPQLREGYFYILYDKSTRHVFEVFYAEKAFDEGLLADLRDKSRSERIKYFRDGLAPCLVGHYAGGRADTFGTPLPTPGVEVVIENAEELTLTVKFTLPDGLPDGVTYSPSVKLYYPANSSTPIHEFSLSALTFAGNTGIYHTVLDSLKSGKHFKDLGSFPSGLGGDFKVVAGLTLSAEGCLDSSYYAKGVDNSLFDTITHDESTAYISNLRHLQNLDSVTSGAANKEAAEQRGDIAAGIYPGLSSSYKFAPIENDNLKSYDGKNFYISSLNVTKESVGNKWGAGLFGSVQSGFVLRNVFLKDSSIAGTDLKNHERTGALVGTTGNIQLENCRTENVTVAGTSSNTDYVGGLLGYSWGKAEFKNCQVVNAKANGTGVAGGMLGEASNATFTDCTVEKVSVKSEKSHAGGLAGNMLYNFTFTRCHTLNAEVSSTGGVVGGIAGYTWSGTISFEDCEVRGSAKMDGSSTGGLLGSEGTLGTVTFTNCKVGEDGNDIRLNGWVNAGGLAGGTDGTARFTGCTVGTSGGGEKTVQITAGSYAGGLVGNAISGQFTQCKASNAIVGKENGTTTEAGGLVGRTEGWNKDWKEDWRIRGSSFQGCTVSNMTVQGDLNVGGLVGGAIDVNMMYYNGPCGAENVTVTAKGSAGGLVGNTIRGQFSDCRAVNAKVDAGNAAGGLIGRVQYTYYTDDQAQIKEVIPEGAQVTNLKNCQVYWNNPSSLKNGDTLLYQVTASTAGGLVSEIRNGAKIRDSFAATLVKGVNYAGGLIGNYAKADFEPALGEDMGEDIQKDISTVAIKESYSDCYIQSGSTAGGLLGMKEFDNYSLNLMDVYAAGFIDSTPSAAGLYGGWSTGTTAQNVYVAMGYTNAPSTAVIYPLAAHVDAFTNASNCHYLNYSGNSDGKTYEQMKGLSMGSAFGTPPETHPYNLDGGTRTVYPFPGLKGLPHYGDWTTS